MTYQTKTGTNRTVTVFCRPAARKFALAIGLLLIFVLMGSAFYVAAEAGHECTDADCPICLSIEACESMLRQADNGVLPLAVSLVISISLILAGTKAVSNFSQESLVSMKIRMND